MYANYVPAFRKLISLSKPAYSTVENCFYNLKDVALSTVCTETVKSMRRIAWNDLVGNECMIYITLS